MERRKKNKTRKQKKDRRKVESYYIRKSQGSVGRTNLAALCNARADIVSREEGSWYREG